MIMEHNGRVSACYQQPFGHATRWRNGARHCAIPGTHDACAGKFKLTYQHFGKRTRLLLLQPLPNCNYSFSLFCLATIAGFALSSAPTKQRWLTIDRFISFRARKGCAMGAFFHRRFANGPISIPTTSAAPTASWNGWIDGELIYLRRSLIR